MSEEIQNAAVVVPRAILLSIVLNGIVGLGTLIAVLFCMGDPALLAETTFTYPFMEVFLQATHSVAGSAVMIAVLITAVLGLAIGTMAAASRMLWAFARDRGVPGWRRISKVTINLLNPLIIAHRILGRREKLNSRHFRCNNNSIFYPTRPN